METTLHQQLKVMYGPQEGDREVWVDGYRIDVRTGEHLVEVQCSPLHAIREKIARLVENHDVLLVVPVAARTRIVRRLTRNGLVISQRWSSYRQGVFHAFGELVSMVRVFPHPRLTVQVLLLEQEEDRFPARRRRGKLSSGDRRLMGIVERFEWRTAGDLLRLIPEGVPAEFSSADLAKHVGIPRWLAQKMAYCLRHMKAIEPVARKRAGWIYRRGGQGKRVRKVA